MDAMILAAGLGTRLRPLTEHTPKALVEVGERPALEHVARRLVAAGADRLIVNVHHHADQVERFLDERDGFGVDVRISREEERPLETGGGLLAAEPLFRKDAPFFLHNVDVLTEIDLEALYAAHLEAASTASGDGPTEAIPPLATLAVSRRETSRPMLVDDVGVRGLANRKTGWRREEREAVGETRERGFSGVHVISPEIFPRITERGVFSIMDVYLRLVSEGARLAVRDVSEALWLEIGDPERLARARRLWPERERGVG